MKDRVDWGDDQTHHQGGSRHEKAPKNHVVSPADALAEKWTVVVVAFHALYAERAVSCRLVFVQFADLAVLSVFIYFLVFVLEESPRVYKEYQQKRWDPQQSQKSEDLFGVPFDAGDFPLVDEG